MKKFIIENAMICDGSGTDPFPGSILVENGKIIKVGVIQRTDVPSVDAAGLLLTPGFIDVHAHSDMSILASPEAFGKLSQGVTTEISGNCGLSPFPVKTPEVREHLQELYANYGVKITWDDFTGFADAVDAVHPAINTMYLCGHNTLRANVLGYGPVESSPADQKRMQTLLREMLGQGACGMSTGLLYVPGKFASPEEIRYLVQCLDNKVYATHLRSEGDRLIEALDEAIAAVPVGGRLQVSHMKVAYPRNYHKIEDYFSHIAAAREKGIRVFADRYPYTFAQTSLSVVLPPPYDKMTDRAIWEALKDSPEKVDALSSELAKMDVSWDRIVLCAGNYVKTADCLGMFFDKAAEKVNTPPHRLCAELMAADAVGTMAAFGGQSPEHMVRIVCSDFVFCGSDETARPRDYSIGHSHPRGFGSFPEFFRIASKALGIGKTIHKMTGLPAKEFNIPDRGLLKPGYVADMVLLDPAGFHAKADFKQPHAPAEGIQSVWVNGELAYAEGRVQKCAGQVLRS